MILNLTKNRIIAKKPLYADTFLLRMRGMIGRKFEHFDAMVFEKCNAIHTMFMSVPIDVVFADRENKICNIYKSLSPWRLMIYHKNAYTVIELPIGSIDNAEIECGDYIDLNVEAMFQKDKQKLISNQQLVNTGAEPALPAKRKPV